MLRRAHLFLAVAPAGEEAVGASGAATGAESAAGRKASGDTGGSAGGGEGSVAAEGAEARGRRRRRRKRHFARSIGWGGVVSEEASAIGPGLLWASCSPKASSALCNIDF